jgi:hypothetical protein
MIFLFMIGLLGAMVPLHPRGFHDDAHKPTGKVVVESLTSHILQKCMDADIHSPRIGYLK